MNVFGLIAGSLSTIAFASMLLVVGPAVQLGRVPPEPGLQPYTEPQLRGRHQYVSLGCVYCHSQQPRDPAMGPDGARGWGRPSTPGDYAHDYPHLLGTMRTGPDLFNIGQRQPSPDWHLVHLYQPRAVVADSIMPSFPFLFEHKAAAAPGDTVVRLPPAFAPAAGVIVATTAALDLAAYLLSLDHTYPSRDLPKAEGARP
jgi:cytochrome c oxidase cbb3-type subunit 2